MRNVAVLMLSSVRPFELAVYSEVFGSDRTAFGLPPVEYAIASERPGVPVPTFGGLAVTPSAGLDRLAEADLVAVAPAVTPERTVSPSVARALRAAVDRGARVMAVCSAAFTLAAAGLLDGRRAATHWMNARQLAEWFPRVTVDPDVLYVDDDPIFTSAGTAAGIDLCLHVVGRAWGAGAAAVVQRGMVLGPYRSADRAQLVTPAPGARRDSELDAVLDWARGNLHEELSVDVLARRALLSRRSFARRFQAATGASPYAWILDQRVRLAQELLESRPWLGVEEAAGRAGFSSAALLRQHFQRRLGCSPSQYRARFAAASPR